MHSFQSAPRQAASGLLELSAWAFRNKENHTLSQFLALAPNLSGLRIPLSEILLKPARALAA
jgi:hypothetical protein